MGKKVNHQETGLALQKHRPGFIMWGILHHLHHFRWHHHKKRLILKPDGSTKPSSDEGSTRTTSDASEAQESIHSSVGNHVVETKPVIPIPSHKNSMKSRIKALMADEVSRRKGGRHRRSTSCPMQAPLDGIIVIHHQESSSGPDPGPASVSSSNYNSCHSHLPGPGEENGGQTGPCKLCTTMLKLNYLKQSEVSRLRRDPVRDHTLLRDKLLYAIEQSKCDSLQESKLFMDALDLLDLRKELFLKILQDPSSSLASQMQRRRAPGVRFGLTKSVSFPARGSSDGTDFKADNGRCNFLVAKGGSQLELPESALKKRDYGNKVGLKRFKNLREKIKHVIWDRKKEKNWIIMDAVHHKIPFGQRISKTLSPGGEISAYDNRGKLGKKQLYKKMSSFNESYNRYNRLLDVSSNKETKVHTSDTLRSGTADNDNNNYNKNDNNSNNNNSMHPLAPSQQAVFKRILSLPDMRSYSFSHIGDSCNTSLVHATDLGNVSGGLTEEKLVDIGLENSKVRLHAVTESVSRENLFYERSALDESVDSKTWETALSHDLNVEEVGPGPASQPLVSGQVSEDGLGYQEDEIGPLLEDSDFLTEDNPPISQLDSTENIADTLESQAFGKLNYDDHVRFHVDPTYKAEFNYVKDILDLSGLMWAVDPLVEGCCLVSQRPEYMENEEDVAWDHLLLFDLVNEVLLDIHDRSFRYWPRPLAMQSSVRLMPRGYRMLEEVWAEIVRLLTWKAEVDQSIDDSVGRDLGKGDRWMNLGMDAEFVAVEVEDLIFDDLVEEIVSN